MEMVNTPRLQCFPLDAVNVFEIHDMVENENEGRCKYEMYKN